jgi:hypothetical protein
MDSHKKILTYSIDMAQVNPMSDDKVVVIRQPSTANLTINSYDRNTTNYATAGEFTIQRNYSILNGFFTRLGVEEVCLEWAIPNIQVGVIDTFTVTITGDAGSPRTITLNPGMYTVAQVLDAIVSRLNNAQATGVFSIDNTLGWARLACTVTYVINDTLLADSLGFLTDVAAALSFQTNQIQQANLALYDFIDIISPDLTYAQKLKDATTGNNSKDVLCRWYLAWDNPPQNDKYGFPILMGYQRFKCRRLFSPPKQIRWEPNLPIGNLSFEVWAGVAGEIAQLGGVDFNFLLTLQVSEV